MGPMAWLVSTQEEEIRIRHTRRKDHVKAQEEVAVCKPKREASDEINPLDILLLDFQPPEL